MADDWKRRVREVLKAENMSMSEASTAAGRGPTFVRDLLERDRSPSIDNFRALAKALKRTVGWLLGEEPSIADQELASHTIRLIEPEVRAGAGGGGIDLAELTDTQNGISISADSIRETWGMPDTFVRGQLRIRGGHAIIVEVYGDSGYDPKNAGAPGSLYPGDRVIVDVDDRRPSPPGPFLVWDGVGLVVKLVEMVRGSDPARIRLKSRNPGYEAYEATEDEARIIGRVRGRISVM